MSVDAPEALVAAGAATEPEAAEAAPDAAIEAIPEAAEAIAVDMAAAPVMVAPATVAGVVVAPALATEHRQRVQRKTFHSPTPRPVLRAAPSTMVLETEGVAAGFLALAM